MHVSPETEKEKRYDIKAGVGQIYKRPNKKKEAGGGQGAPNLPP